MYIFHKDPFPEKDKKIEKRLPCYLRNEIRDVRRFFFNSEKVVDAQESLESSVKSAFSVGEITEAEAKYILKTYIFGEDEWFSGRVVMSNTAKDKKNGKQA